MEFKSIFSAATGGPSEFYRIPAMVTTKNGVVVACADADGNRFIHGGGKKYTLKEG